MKEEWTIDHKKRDKLEKEASKRDVGKREMGLCGRQKVYQVCAWNDITVYPVERPKSHLYVQHKWTLEGGREINHEYIEFTMKCIECGLEFEDFIDVRWIVELLLPRWEYDEERLPYDEHLSIIPENTHIYSNIISIYLKQSNKDSIMMMTYTIPISAIEAWMWRMGYPMWLHGRDMEEKL